MGLWPIFFQLGPLKISDGWGPKILQGWVRKISKQGGPTYPDPPRRTGMWVVLALVLLLAVFGVWA